MIKHTKSYQVFRTHSQQMLDFSVLICTSVPQLRHAFEEFDKDPNTYLATNSQFRPSNEPYATERRSMNSYKKVLGANLVLSVFSYFETYFFSVIDEIIEFHGGKDGMLKLAKKQVLGKPITKDENEKNLRFLREPYKPNKADRYRKYTKELEDESVLWPTQRLMLYGVSQLNILLSHA